MLQPYRGVGFITDAKPFSISSRRNRHLLVSIVSNTYHVYDTAQLRLIRVGPTFPRPLQCIAVYGAMEFVAYQGYVVGLLCTKEAWKVQHSAVGDVLAIQPVPPKATSTTTSTKNSGNLNNPLTECEIVTFASDRTVRVWRGQEGKLLHHALLDHDTTYVASSLTTLPPELYKNKFLIGTADGTLQLWNYKTGAKVFESAKGLFGGAESSIMCCVLCSYLPTICAVGTDTGNIYVYDFTTNEVLMEFNHADNAAVRTLAFSNGLMQLLVSGSESGEVAVWDLGQRTLRGVLDGTVISDRNNAITNEPCHANGCVHLQFLRHEPVLVSSGGDNNIRMFAFDGNNKSGRLLRFRQGHRGDCSQAVFLDDLRIITLGGAADRSVRMNHVFTDLFSVELSQGKLRRLAKQKLTTVEDLRLSPPIAMSSCLPRRNDWASIVTVHQSSPVARTWRMDNMAITKHQLSFGTDSVGNLTAVVCSRCGHYCVIGNEVGGLGVFHLQNGEYRGLLEPNQHKGPITGIYITACNRYIIATSRDGIISVWVLSTGEFVKTMHHAGGGSLEIGTLHAEAALLLVAGGDHTVYVYDVNPAIVGSSSSSQPVRVLRCHSAPITGVALDPSTSRFVLTTSLDTTLCIWDLVNGSLLARYRFDTPATSVGFDPNSLFVITTHPGCRGCYVWTNMMRYGVRNDDRVPENAQNLQHNLESIPLLIYPNSIAEGTTTAADEAASEGLKKKRSHNGAAQPDNNKAPAANLGEITLSGIARAKIVSIPIYDAVKSNSKPIMPPKQYS
eukprot:PhF_6_TR40783/c0_g1_i3/m.61558/K14554/UTP21, WDR36; U3 small nucleolar RNA-associated protein 21